MSGVRGVAVDKMKWLNYLLAYTATTEGRRALRRDTGVSIPPRGERINRWPRDVMNRKIRNELSHIPRGEIRGPQNLLRFCYSGMRRHDMVYTNKEKEDTLKEAIGVVQKVFPTFITKYDKRFFKLR